jgi:hypothetical protein
MDSVELLKRMHRGVRFAFENTIKTVFTPEQMKERVDDKGNSIVWLAWHLARTEDVVTNTILQGTPQLLTQDNWQARLGIHVTHIGTGLGDEGAAEITKQINVEAADDYWQAVAKASYEWLKAIDPKDLEEVPNLPERLAAVPPVLASATNQGVTQFWNGLDAGRLFSAIVIGHGYIHIGQMQEIGGRLGRVGWF